MRLTTRARDAAFTRREARCPRVYVRWKAKAPARRVEIMHPGFIAFWQRAHRGGDCGPSECATGVESPWHRGHRHGRREESPFEASGFDGDAGFGVRRPLRFLAFKLELDERQVAEIAAVLNDLKTERAQAAVDQRRTTTAFADAIADAALDPAKLADAAKQRVQATQRLQDAVAKALAKIHAILDEEQRRRLAYLLRTGALSV
jgi:hypothetical protein